MASSDWGKALITGASSGIGAAFSEVLAERGQGLVLVARRGELLERKAQTLRSAHGVEVEIIQADLAKRPDLLAVETRLERGDVGLLVNNAGIGGQGSFLDTPRDAHEEMIAVNVTALTRLAHAACAGMAQQGRGTVINLASGFAFDFMPGASVYAASKAYVFQLTQVLAAELSDRGLRFQCLVPGLTRTNLGNAEETGLFDRFPQEMIQSPRAVVEASLAGLELGELVCMPKVEDISAFTAAHEQYRTFGREPGHNRVATRYKVDMV